MTIPGQPPMKLRPRVIKIGVAAVMISAAAAPATTTHPVSSFELVRSELPSVNGKIAFVDCPHRTKDCEIAVIDPHGTGRKQLTANDLDDTYPAWSPDGKKIAFVRILGDVWDIYVMNADGTRQRDLTKENPWSDWDPDWSPDGKRIAFNSDRDPANSDIYVMNADGTGLTSFPRDPLLSDWEPAWSPDGTKIAFTACANVPEMGCEIYVMGADGNDRTNLTNNPHDDFWPVWSPDGSQIAFSSDRDGNNEIYVMNADGSGQTNMSMNDAWDVEPAWSPDGTKIAFTTNRPGTQINVMNADGSGLPRDITDSSGEGDGSEHYASWGPDIERPETTIASGPERSTTDRTPTFRFRSNEPGSRFRCKLDSRRYERCDSPKTYARLPVGSHTFSVRAIDVAGNKDRTPARFVWTIER